LRPGSGLGFGLGAFLTSFLPLSLLPMAASMTQKACAMKETMLTAGQAALSLITLSDAYCFSGEAG
jgi:hypothetical protein